VGLTLLDTGVVIGFLDGDDAFHRAAHGAISELARGDDFFAMSAVSYAELLTGVGLGHHPREVVIGFLHDFAVRILAVDETVAARAAEIRATHTAKARGGRRRPTVRMPDALILATAAVDVDVDLLLVADRQWPKVDIGMEVRLLEAT
jgi:predicted nucleic acid-binding protein